jgi:phosphogluconate dehydratase
VLTSFRAGELDRDVVVVVRQQGPRANGMPELHKLTPSLTVLQNRGHQVALVTDGRMSGASGQVPAAIQVSPEALCGGTIAKVENGDEIIVDAAAGRLELLVDASVLDTRTPVRAEAQTFGFGRELFARFRASATAAEAGGSPLLGAGS